MGIIPLLPETPGTPIQNTKSPLTYYSKSLSGVTPGTIDLEDIPGQVWYIHHIFYSVTSFGDTYAVLIKDKNESVFLNYENIANERLIDIDYKEPLIFKDRIRLIVTASGAGGDVYVVTFVGYVQDK